MPSFVLQRPCRHPGCPALVPAGASPYCPAHTRAASAIARARARHRGSAAARGYDYRWQQARANFLARYPLCSGVLIPTPAWTVALAQEFHLLRERERAAGALLLFSRPSGPASQWLAIHPIYRFEPWDHSRPATIVDHIVPHRGDPLLMWSEWNWQPLTKRAHDRKTATEERGASPLSAT